MGPAVEPEGEAVVSTVRVEYIVTSEVTYVVVVKPELAPVE